jgi:hypothetical protein
MARCPSIEILTANVKANEAYLREALKEGTDRGAVARVITALDEGDFCKPVARVFTADPEAFRLYYARLVAEVLAGRPRLSDLTRRVRRCGLD